MKQPRLKEDKRSLYGTTNIDPFESYETKKRIKE
jgi:hypothetical protein